KPGKLLVISYLLMVGSGRERPAFGKTSSYARGFGATRRGGEQRTEIRYQTSEVRAWRSGIRGSPRRIRPVADQKSEKSNAKPALCRGFGVADAHLSHRSKSEAGTSNVQLG